MKSHFLERMIFQIYLENGWTPWLAFQTTDKTRANEFIKKSTALYTYLYTLSDNHYLVDIVCIRRQINGL